MNRAPLYRDTYEEAKEAVRKFKKTLPVCIRKTVRFIGYSIEVGPGKDQETVKAIFEDENGRHDFTISE